MLSSVDTTCHSMVRMCDCICGLWVAESSKLIAFAALTEMLPDFSSLSAIKTSLIILRTLFCTSLFFVMASRVSTARVRRSLLSFSFCSFLDDVVVKL